MTMMNGRARSATGARRFRARNLDLNDPSMLEIIKRDGKMKITTDMDYTVNRGHNVFNDLNNSKLLTDMVRNKKARRASSNREASDVKNSKKRSIGSLKKQLHYVNFSKQNFDLINKRRLSEVYQKFNNNSAFDYNDNRSKNFKQAIKNDKRKMQEAK